MTEEGDKREETTDRKRSLVRSECWLLKGALTWQWRTLYRGWCCMKIKLCSKTYIYCNHYMWAWASEHESVWVFSLVEEACCNGEETTPEWGFVPDGPHPPATGDSFEKLVSKTSLQLSYVQTTRSLRQVIDLILTVLNCTKTVFDKLHLRSISHLCVGLQQDGHFVVMVFHTVPLRYLK